MLMLILIHFKKLFFYSKITEMDKLAQMAKERLPTSAHVGTSIISNSQTQSQLQSHGFNSQGINELIKCKP